MWRRKPSLVVQFAVLSLVGLISLGVFLGTRLQNGIEGRAIEGVERSNLMSLNFVMGMSSGLSQGDLSSAEARSLEEGMRASLEGTNAVRVDTIVADGLIYLSTDSAAVGTTDPRGTEFRQALGQGLPASRVLRGTTSGMGPNVDALLRAQSPLLVTYVPVRMAKGQPVVGVARTFVRWQETQDEIAQEARQIYTKLAGGLALLWALLFRLVWTASRRVQEAGVRMREQSEQMARQAEETRFLAEHDALTALPNRTLLAQRTEEALAAAKEQNGSCALMLLNLDRLKEVNDALGHSAGDELLRQVGPRLAKSLPTAATVARIGGDEFTVLLPSVPSAEAAAAYAQRTLLALREPFSLGEFTADVEAAIGIAVSPEHGETFELLFQRADVAMHAAKSGTGEIVTYTPAIDSYSVERLGLLGELREAIETGQLILHYQPKAMLEDGEVVGVEALVRWQHPTRGLLGPNTFIPLAEHTSLVRPLTLEVLDQALAQTRAWKDIGIHLRISVNIATRCLLDDDFPDHVMGIAARHGVKPEEVMLEITESAIMTDPEQALRVLDRLHAAGFRLSIDDFGTGYSSMAYLKNLPVHELKIDRSFVKDIATDLSDRAIVATSVQLGRNLGLTVVAEGVEEAAGWEQLRALGCSEVQGYFLARPMPARDLAGWIQARGVTGAQHEESSSAV